MIGLEVFVEVIPKSKGNNINNRCAAQDIFTRNPTSIRGWYVSSTWDGSGFHPMSEAVARATLVHLYQEINLFPLVFLLLFYMCLFLNLNMKHLKVPSLNHRNSQWKMQLLRMFRIGNVLEISGLAGIEYHHFLDKWLLSAFTNHDFSWN